MEMIIPSNGRAFTVKLDLQSRIPQRIVIIAKDANKPNTVYVHREAMVKNKREIELRFPVSPGELKLEVFSLQNGRRKNGQDSSFNARAFVEDLKTYPVRMTPEADSFYNFAVWFAENATILAAGSGPKDKPKVYKSDDGKYTIAYFNFIYDRRAGRLKTPARVEHNSGIIDVSKQDFLSYTVPMRLMILLHEWAHKYQNPKFNLPIDFESGADINGLTVYLAKGWSDWEAIHSFLKVFADNRTPWNKKRYLAIREYIRKFHSGEARPKGVAA